MAKTYTEEQLKMALEYQLAESYQVVGNMLISDDPAIEAALDYLSSSKTLSIDQIDKLLSF